MDFSSVWYDLPLSLSLLPDRSLSLQPPLSLSSPALFLAVTSFFSLPFLCRTPRPSPYPLFEPNQGKTRAGEKGNMIGGRDWSDIYPLFQVLVSTDGLVLRAAFLPHTPCASSYAHVHAPLTNTHSHTLTHTHISTYMHIYEGTHSPSHVDMMLCMLL